MNGYKAFFRGRTIDVYAETSLEAQQKASMAFKARKQYDVTVMLCERDDAPVTVSTNTL